jgi:hypothetical protein
VARVLRAPAWFVVSALLVLVTHSLAYVLAPLPSPLASRLEQDAGGPRLVVVSLAVLGLAFTLAAAVVGVIALALRERLALHPATVLPQPHFRPGRLLLRFGSLFTAVSLGFALLESCLHWRAGLGWHGLACLLGPVHRDALPLVTALVLLAVAVLEALEQLVSWTRRVFRRLLARGRMPQTQSRSWAPHELAVPRRWWVGRALAARGPPPFPFAAADAALRIP